MKHKTLKEFLTGLALFGGFMFCMYGAGQVQAAPIAGASAALAEQLEETDNMIYVGVMYASKVMNVREHPSTDSDIVCTLSEYEPIKVWAIGNSEWYRTKSGYYVYRDLLITESEVPDSTLYDGLWSTFKSYTDYRALTATGSPQFALQQRAYTGNYGIRMVDDRYCVAVGSGITTDIGRKIDVILYDGTVIPCVVCDQKSDRHTDASHIYTTITGTRCATEFYVETGVLYPDARNMGDLSEIPGWDSGVVAIRVWNDFV